MTPRHLHYHLSTKHDPPIVREEYIEMDKQTKEFIRKNIKSTIVPSIVGFLIMFVFIVYFAIVFG